METCKNWTHAETTQLKRLASKGKNNRQIAESLGKTDDAIRGRKYKLGITGKRYSIWSEWELHRLRRYCKRNYPLDRIAIYFPNRTRRDVQQRIWKMTRFWQSPEERAIRKRYREKWMQWRVY